MELRPSFQNLLFRHRYPPKAAVAGITLFGLLGLAACGGSGSGSGSGSDRHAAAPVSPSDSEPASAVPTATARPVAVILHAHDYLLTEGSETRGFVRGISPSNSPSLSTQQISETKLAACLGVPVSQVHSHATDLADGAYFTSNDGLTTIGSETEITSAVDVARDMDILSRPQAPVCLGQAFFPMVREGISAAGGNATLDSARALTPPAGGAGGVRMVMTVTGGGKRVPVTLDIIFIMSGRVESNIVISQVDGTPDPTVEQDAVRQVAGKIAQQAGVPA
ncbi:hypothetical protein [Frankia sp. CiP3]|uniref:hypothetical protein n=1 Tax=Frankia sp. CiP3 TaxID=2880971 RepID=UPI001EF46A6D|nr:hypothetical protein [Frankia sp. CiP3]